MDPIEERAVPLQDGEAQNGYWLEANFTYRASESGEMVKVGLRRQVMFRTELEYIADDLRRWTGEAQWRLGWHNYLTCLPSITNEVGFMLHTYVAGTT